jgi:hypothetical protein
MPREYVFVLASGETVIREADSPRHAECIAREVRAKFHTRSAMWETFDHVARCLLMEA